MLARPLYSLWLQRMLLTASRCTAGAVTSDLSWRCFIYWLLLCIYCSCCGTEWRRLCNEGEGDCDTDDQVPTHFIHSSVFISSYFIFIQCSGLLECGSDNCATKSGGYWDGEVRQWECCSLQILHTMSHNVCIRTTVARDAAPVSGSAGRGRARVWQNVPSPSCCSPSGRSHASAQQKNEQEKQTII